jgi:hypothetical protein
VLQSLVDEPRHIPIETMISIQALHLTGAAAAHDGFSLGGHAPIA